MRKHALTTVVALMTAGALAVPAVASAPINGHIDAYKTHSNNTGTVTVKLANGHHQRFIVWLAGHNRTTCGISQGQSGGPLPGGCKNLDHYRGYEVNVVKRGHDSASLVSVVQP